MKKILGLILILALCPWSALADVPAPPADARILVFDDAQQLTPEAIKMMESYGKLMWETYGVEVLLLTVSGLDGMNVYTYAQRLNTAWERPTEKSVLLLYALSDQRCEIFPSKDLDEILDPALCQRMVEDKVWPAQDGGELSAGLLDAYFALCDVLAEKMTVSAAKERSLEERIQGWVDQFVQETVEFGQVVAEESVDLAEALAEAGRDWWRDLKDAFAQ